MSVLQAMLAQQRDEMATARTALDSERAAMRALRRDTAAEINAARKEEVDKYTNMLSDLKSRYGISVTVRTIIRNKHILLCFCIGVYNGEYDWDVV